LQDALSNKIAKTLAFELTHKENKLFVRRGTDNTEAYEKYLRGRFHQSQNTPNNLSRSIEFYEQAIALDPNFAEAYADIADAHIILFNFGFRPAEETILQARESVNRALQLDPDLSRAHMSLALIQFLIDRNWAAAEKSLERAIALNPNNADAYHRYAYFLMQLGRFDESLQKAEKACELIFAPGGIPRPSGSWRKQRLRIRCFPFQEGCSALRMKLSATWKRPSKRISRPWR
jgi:tetratricopeptide (TPR) repeat protein